MPVMKVTSDIAELVLRGGQNLTQAEIADVRKRIPWIKAKAAYAAKGKFANLEPQADLLGDYVEDCLDGKFPGADDAAVMEACFALHYLSRGVDIIPDSIPELGYSDDASIVLCVMTSHEPEFRRYAESRGIEWSEQFHTI